MIKLIVLDVDGCLTDGKIIYSAQGDETKAFHVKDGLAIASWIKLGHDVAIITGRNSDIVVRRAKELGIAHLFQGVKNKDAVLEALRIKLHLQWEHIAAIGDDLNDYKMLQRVGLSFTPKDGSIYIQECVHHTLNRSGGEGAVREMIEYILKENNEEGDFVALWQ